MPLGTALGAAGAGIIGHQNTINSGYAAQQATTGAYMSGTMMGYPVTDENQHVFNCTKVENGWTFTYRSKTHIATNIDEMMEQMKAAMVSERISK